MRERGISPRGNRVLMNRQKGVVKGDNQYVCFERFFEQVKIVVSNWRRQSAFSINKGRCNQCL